MEIAKWLDRSIFTWCRRNKWFLLLSNNNDRDIFYTSLYLIHDYNADIWITQWKPKYLFDSVRILNLFNSAIRKKKIVYDKLHTTVIILSTPRLVNSFVEKLTQRKRSFFLCISKYMCVCVCVCVFVCVRVCWDVFFTNIRQFSIEIVRARVNVPLWSILIIKKNYSPSYSKCYLKRKKKKEEKR